MIHVRRGGRGRKKEQKKFRELYSLKTNGLREHQKTKVRIFIFKRKKTNTLAIMVAELTEEAN